MSDKWKVWMRGFARLAVMLLVCLFAGPRLASAQGGTRGVISGIVRLESDGSRVPGARVFLLGTRRVATTDREGVFELADVPAGTHEMVVQRDALSAPRQTITVRAGARLHVDVLISSAAIHEEITVTAAAGGAGSVFEAFNAVTTVEGARFAARRGTSIADSVRDEVGVAVRSFGASNTRPIIRGFDGDRVLIMENGMRTGDLSSTSADHAVAIDPASLGRLEVVRGPATLLFGNNAIGGVVNAISPEETLRGTAFDGLLGTATVDLATADHLAGTAVDLTLGRGRWLVWAQAGGRRSDDYAIPDGRVDNSGTARASGRGGIGWTGSHWFGSAGVQLERNRFEIPLSEDGVFVVDEGRRTAVRGDFGASGLTRGLFENIRARVAFTDYQQDETEIDGSTVVLGTRFDNDTLNGRVEFEQRPLATLIGRLGVDGIRREFEASGEEALAPRTSQVSGAVFGYEEIAVGPHRIEVGGRVERTAYEPDDRREEPDDLDEPEHAFEPSAPISRSFVGLSGSMGVNLDLGRAGSLIANLTKASRAPALEELYNFGPDAGNGTFEIGDPTLDVEDALGLEISFRKRGPRGSVQLSTFRYDIGDFVFLDVTEENVDLLQIARYVQADARFTGVEAKADIQVTAFLNLSAGVSQVNASLVETGEFLPRIPPVAGHLRAELTRANFRIAPMVSMSARQAEVFRDETPTDGWVTFGFESSYVIVDQHVSHMVTVSGGNLMNTTYRTHTAFLKDLAPEPGRSLRASYTLKFF